MAYTILETILITLGVFFSTAILAAIIMFIMDLVGKFYTLCSHVEDIKIYEQMKFEKRR